MTEDRVDSGIAPDDVRRGDDPLDEDEVASLAGHPLPDRAAMSLMGVDPLGVDIAIQHVEPPFDSVEPQPVD